MPLIMKHNGMTLQHFLICTLFGPLRAPPTPACSLHDRSSMLTLVFLLGSLSKHSSCKVLLQVTPSQPCCVVQSHQALLLLVLLTAADWPNPCGSRSYTILRALSRILDNRPFSIYTASHVLLSSHSPLRHWRSKLRPSLTRINLLCKQFDDGMSNAVKQQAPLLSALLIL